jgi:CBS domain containing-hemolysin-like protein
MAGLVFNALGRRPREEDEVTVDDVHMRVEQVDGPRITRLLVTVPT